MIARISAFLGLVFVLLGAHNATAREMLWPAEVAIPNTRVIHFTSAINGEPYTLSIGIPFGPPPKSGYSVLYVLDGDAYFSTAHLLGVTLQDKAPIVVGIGHDALIDKSVISRYAPRAPNDKSPMGMPDAGKAFQRLRVLDMTLPLAPEHRSPAWFDADEGGNVDAFLRVIETEIKPKVAAIRPVNKANQALYGHSFGGLAVVRALFTEPQAFHTFIVSSPSLWWDGNAVLAGEAAYSTKLAAGKVAPRVLITSAANEQDSTLPPKTFLDTLPADKAAELAPYIKMRSQWVGMISGAKSLAGRLAKLKAGAGYDVKYELIPGADHPDAAFTSIGRGLHYAFDQ